MRRKKDEVTGKPTQYNLQTLEYDWKELPDTHFRVEQNAPRVRDYANYGAPSNNHNGGGNPSHVSNGNGAAQGNANQRRGDEGLDMKNILGGGAGAHVRSDAASAEARMDNAIPRDAPRSPQPAPAPSHPAQEFAFKKEGVVPSSSGDDNSRARQDQRSADAGAGRARGDVKGNLDAELLRAIANGYAGAFAPPQHQQQQQQPMYVAPWSHEDLKRQVLMNQMEAGRSYLHQAR